MLMVTQALPKMFRARQLAASHFVAAPVIALVLFNGNEEQKLQAPPIRVIGGAAAKQIFTSS